MAYKEYKYDPYVRAWNRIADRGEVCSGNFDPRNNPDDRRRLIAGIVLVVAFLLLFVLFSGCTRRVYVPVERTTTVTEIVKDTVVEVILEVRKDTVTVEAAGRDTTSYLENGSHFSRATWKEGKLGHSLGTLPGASVKDTVPFKMVIVRDSIPYPVEVEVEKKLSWWQRQKMEYGGIAIGAASFFAFVTGMLLKGARKRD